MKGNQKKVLQPGVFGRDALLYGIMVVLCAVLMVQMISFVGDVFDYQDYQRANIADETMLIDMITAREYDFLLDHVYRNEAAGAPVKGNREALYAVAHYYEAAMLYHAHQRAGNEEQAQAKYAKMQEYEKKMGTYAFVKEDIWDFLGIGQEILK